MFSRYKLTLTPTQLKVIQEALDFTSRMKMGQFQELNTVRPLAPYIDFDELAQLKARIFPELHRDSFHGITSDKIPESCRIAYDLVQVIRHRLSWDGLKNKDDKPGITVNFDKPMQTSTEKLAEIEGEYE